MVRKPLELYLDFLNRISNIRKSLVMRNPVNFSCDFNRDGRRRLLLIRLMQGLWMEVLLLAMLSVTPVPLSRLLL